MYSGRDGRVWYEWGCKGESNIKAFLLTGKDAYFDILWMWQIQSSHQTAGKVMPWLRIIWGNKKNMTRPRSYPFLELPQHPQIPKAKHVQVAAALAVPSHRPAVPRPSSAFNGIPREGLGIGFCADSGHLEHQQRMGVGLELELVIHTALDLHLTRTVNQDCKQ